MHKLPAHRNATSILVYGVLYVYDAAGMITLKTIRTAGATNTVAYVYDELNRLVREDDGVTAREYDYDLEFHVHDGAHVIADTESAGNLIRTYTWGPGIGNLLAITLHDGEATDTYQALTDHLGTVWALVDENGTVAESYHYDAWGSVIGVFDAAGLPLISDLGLPTSALGNRYLFQGREYSWTTGLYNFRARWYEPETGRWLSNDPIGISGGLNQYQAFASNPVNFVDPWGGAPAAARRLREAYNISAH